MSEDKEILELKKLQKQKERHLKWYTKNRAYCKTLFEKKAFNRNFSFIEVEDQGLKVSSLHAESFINLNNFEDNFHYGAGGILK